MSLGAALYSTSSFVLKYGTIWFALYTARYLIVLLIVEPYKSYLRYLPGPRADGYLSSRLVHDVQNPLTSKQTHEKYEELYGKTVGFQGTAGFDTRVITIDKVSINYMLNRAADLFEKPWQTRRFVGRLIAGGNDNIPGIFTSEGEIHRKLRRILAPAFSHQSVKRLTPLFLHKSFELRDKLRSVLAVEHTAPGPGVEVEQFPEEPRPCVRMDLHNWIGRATFDIIGVAGFGYEFHSIQDETNGFYNAYRCMFDALSDNPLRYLALFLPSWIATRIPDARNQEVKKCREVIEAETQNLLVACRKAVATEKAAGAAVGKDFSILNLLLRTNESSGATLTDTEILTQIESIMFAGHDTTSLAIQWGLWELAQNPSVQARLRAELAPFASILKDFPSTAPSDIVNVYADVTGELVDLSAKLDALPYFENVVREVMRLHPSIHTTMRAANQDGVIPVSEPIRVGDKGEMSKAWVGGHKTGLPSGGVQVRKGEFIHIPIEAMNTTKTVWGEDAHEFNPERWNNLPAAAKSNPGLYAGLMTFSVGPSACPASRWAILELKLMVAVLVASFELTGSSPMNGHNFIVTRPYVNDQFERGHRMPLVMTAIA